MNRKGKSKKHLKRSGMGPRDLISDLPDNVIHGIMERLPLRDAARLSTLSWKWREYWQTLPALVLDGNFFSVVLGKQQSKIVKYRSIVSKILLQHNGPINKFTLYIPHRVKPDVSHWISFLSINCIKELTIKYSKKKSHQHLKLPFRLFCCVELTMLKLNNSMFKPPRSFKGFQKLISIDLENVSFSKDNIFEDFISNCPLLENLRVKIKNDPTENLVIRAPNLKYLVISGTFKSICLNGSQGLLSASISLAHLGENVVTDREQFFNYLVSSCKVEKLCFRRFFVKYLVKAGVSKKLPVTFTHVRNLQLTGMDVGKELSCALGIIHSCPNIASLLFSVQYTMKPMEHDLNFDLSCTYSQLRDINVRLNRVSVAEFKFIEFLLACSPVLETLNLEIRELDAKAKLLRNLKQLSKASPNVIFCVSATCKYSDETSDSDNDEHLDADADLSSTDSDSSSRESVSDSSSRESVSDSSSRESVSDSSSRESVLDSSSRRSVLDSSSTD